MNDIRERIVCTDKLRTYTLLSHALAEAGPPLTLPLTARPDVIARLEGWSAKHGWVVVKPRWGAASVGVERTAAVELLRELNTGSDRSGLVVQRWIPVDEWEDLRGRFRYDLRLFVIGGRVIGGFARRAAATSTGIGGGSKLGWLTTSGPLLPVALRDPQNMDLQCAPNDPSALSLRSEEIADASAVACRAVAILDAAARELSYSEVSSIPSFGELMGERDPIRIVRLRAGA